MSAIAGRRLCFCFAAVVLYLAAAGAQESRQAQIFGLIKSRVDAGKNVGMAVGTVDHEGTTTIAAYGNPGPGSLPIDADSVFEIGSITKVFTAILLADMAERGEVALDDPIKKYLPGNMRVPEPSISPRATTPRARWRPTGTFPRLRAQGRCARRSTTC